MPNPYVILAAVLIFIASVGGAYIKGGNDRENDVRGELATHERDAIKTALTEYQAKVTKGDQQHAQDQATIARLSATARSLRTHFPTCDKQPQAVTDSNGGTGLVPSGVDESFERFKQRTEQIIERCERLNSDARRSNALTQ